MSKRYEVLKADNGRYVVKDNFRGLILSGMYDTREQAERIADLFENIRLDKEVKKNE